MTDTLYCALRWILAASVLPGGIAAVAYGLHRYGKWSDARRAPDPVIRPARSPGYRRVIYAVDQAAIVVGATAACVSGLAVAAGIGYTSARSILPLFGCDDCLPRAWQEQCAAGDAARLEAEDRAAVAAKLAEIRGVCERWSWKTCPAPQEWP